ncbi:phosphonate transport system permease protein [Chromobacterium alkanivorans]|uniref:phosphonate ABC transporter, permease protein PhnE n=1 Tax=Chromobacterium alkanivorans TaxID=1071719 RepID=UPI002169C8B4|nr:phosphonate ABC transporter, permease protein PhnE [Chromobacterium alkanivorans]MCS3806126.1 phosphonate transport system permease protein [Chromobacterium alkanivorans]MCS3820472.1 phosphonate transport system permease protein [Chromobacterium alkanivorans]MCS3875230.1 phosphonate transport system permease protein [Chromobacterium alkanivorans]
MLKPRDPAARARLGWLLLTLALLLPTLPLTQFTLGTLLNGDTWLGLARFAAGFLPPAHDGDFLREVAKETATTLAVASAGLLLAMLLGAPLAFATSRALDDHQLTASPPHRATLAAQSLLRGLMVWLRGVPDIVWALLFVRAAGLGSLPAVLALGLAYGGMLGKVYAEILESQPRAPAQALAVAGASRWQRLCWALWPQTLPELISYSVYRWECAIRASAVMGFVGAGGIGQLLDSSLKMLNGGEVATLLLVFLLLVGLSEAVSRWSRRALERDGGRRLLLAGGALVVFSLAWLWPDWRANGFDWRGLPHFAMEFLPPDFSVAALRQLGQGVVETLAMSALGTVLAALLAMPLALPAAGRLGAAAKRATRLLLNALRGIPDLLWAALAVLALGLGPAAGVLALAMHTAGVLGRLFAETLENAPPQAEQALLHAGAGRVAAFCYGPLPVVASQWLAYTLYRWENNIRIATVLGIVGAGGLGQQLYLALSLFQQQAAAAVILAMVALSWGVEQLSRALRRRMG